MDCIERYNLVLQKANNQVRYYIPHEVLVAYQDYVTALKQKPINYSSRKVAKDLLQMIPKAGAFKIVPRQNTHTHEFFNVYEYQQMKAVKKHFFVASAGYVFDPRFTNFPISCDDYMDFMQSINSMLIGWETCGKL